MRTRLVILIALITWLCLLPSCADAQEREPPTHATLRNLLEEYPWELPIHKAKALGPGSVDPLLEMLRTPEHEKHRDQIVVLLGLIGDARAVRPLKSLVLQDYEGEVDWADFDVVIAAVNALGDLARAGSNDALEFLAKHRFPTDWAREGLSWRHRTMSHEDVCRVLSLQTLMALGRSGRAEALETLHQMRETAELEPILRDIAKDAVDLHEKIQEKGLRAALDPRFDPDEVLKVGRHVYDADVRQLLLDRRPDFLSQFLAENGQPVLVVEHGGTPDRDEYLLNRLAQEPGGLETQRQILLDIEAAEEVKRGTPIVTIADDGAAVVAIPLENSQTLVKRHFPQGVKGVTVDAEGRLVIHMIRSKDNRWYWNPFGW